MKKIGLDSNLTNKNFAEVAHGSTTLQKEEMRKTLFQKQKHFIESTGHHTPLYGDILIFLQKTVFILIWSLHSIPYCHADLRDPTRPSSFSARMVKQETNQTNFLKLSSISISAHAKRATINGVSAKQGENILSDIKIITISNNTVLIEQNGIRKKLYLLTRSYKNK